MSVGCSPGDFVSVSALAWTVYKSCKDAPESFSNISLEVLSLHAVLKEGDEVLTAQSFSLDRKSRLDTVLNGCSGVLEDLRTLVEKYESLGTQTRRTWDRMRWGLEDIAEMRSRLTSNVALLSAFISTSQVVVEKRLKSILRDFQDERRQGSVITSKTVESMSVEDKETWREIRNELEEAGITVAALNMNKDFVINYLKQNSIAGASDEDILMDDPGESSSDAPGRDFSSTVFSSAPSSRQITPETSVEDLQVSNFTLSRTQLLTLDVGNTHHAIVPRTFSPSNKHDWTFFISPSRTNLIKEVMIILHSTFRPPTITCTHPPYEVRRLGWGYFTIRAAIVLKPGYCWASVPNGFVTRPAYGRPNAAVHLEWTLLFEGEGGIQSHSLTIGRETR